MNQSKIHSISFVCRASFAAFGAYFCMYAFRKPFSVAIFEGLEVFNIDYKIILIIAQVIGYALSKFIGIKVISELKRHHRALYLVMLILVAELMLILFAFVPKPYNIICMFLNGIPLGMIWGIVFSYLEGRRFTEILGVALSTSFIVSSGIVKSVGFFTMAYWGTSEFWMPAVTGALFILPLVFFSYQLEQIPVPTKEDEDLRSQRLPMSKKDRSDLLKKFMIPISLWVIFYMFLTSFRDLRDNFARELWDSIGFEGDVSVYSTSETLVACIVLLVLALAFYFKDNMKALRFYQILLFLGSLITGGATYLFQIGGISPFYWMVVSGFGLYICYVPFNCLFFDRFIGAFKIKGNAGFLIYIADAFGYLGSVIILLFKNFGQTNLSWLAFFIKGAYVLAGTGILITISTMVYLRKRNKNNITNYQIMINENKV